MGLTMAGALSFIGCADDYLDTAPTDAISNITIAQDMETLYLGLNGIHRQMVSQESEYQCLGGLPGINMCIDIEADDITWQTNTWMKSAYLGWQCNTNEQNGYNTVIWRLHYQWIMNANGLLETLENTDVSALGDSDKALYEQIKGEALVIRAFAHYQLVQLYADRYKQGGNNSQPGIPYRDVEHRTGELARHSVEETYRMINADLAEACSLLEGKEISDLNHYSAKSAYGMRARVALTMHDYAKAAEYAATAIRLAEEEGGKLMEGDQLYCGFSDITSDTDEAMYAAMTQADQTVYFYSYYAYMSWNFSSTAIRQGVKAINADTYDTMSETDLRRAWWDPTGKADVPLTSFKKIAYQNRKYTARSSSNAVGDVAFMRLAEMYLTQAEALARNGQTTEAQEVFTKFQITRDPNYVTGSGDLIQEIMNSRRVELWGEGQRFFDLKRLNIDLVRGRNFDITFCTFLEKKADAKGWTWEIPKIETDNNTACEKNY